MYASVYAHSASIPINIKKRRNKKKNIEKDPIQNIAQRIKQHSNIFLVK